MHNNLILYLKAECSFKAEQCGIKMIRLLTVYFSLERLYPGWRPWIVSLTLTFSTLRSTPGVPLSHPKSVTLGLFGLTFLPTQEIILLQIILNSDFKSNKRQQFGTIQGW